MTSVFTARRRAEEFSSLVEGHSTGKAPDARLAEWLELVSMLQETPAPEPRPEFSADLRTRLMSAADSLLVPSDDVQRLTLPPRRTGRERRITAAVGGIAIVGASASLALAAQSALPGEMLYPLKRAMEDAGTGLHGSDEAKGVALLASASDRLDEARALSRTGDLGEAEHVEAVLVDFADQATEASDLLLQQYAESGDKDSVEQLRDFTAASMDTLAQLEAVLPEQARDELLHAAQVLDEIDDAAARACPSCRGGIDRIPPVLLSADVLADHQVVVSDSLVSGTSIRPSGRDTDRNDGRDAPDTGSGGTGGTGSLPDWNGVTGSPTDTSGSAGDNDNSGTLEELTETLTGQGGEQTSNDGLTGVPELDDVIEDTVEDTVDDVDDSLGDLP